MITWKIESKILTNDVSCEYKCKFDGRKHNLNQKWITTNVDPSVKKHIGQPDYICNPSTCSCKNVIY